MKFGKRRQDADAPHAEDVPTSVADPAPPPPTHSWTDPVVEHPAPAADAPPADAETFFHKAPAAGDESVYHQGPVVEGDAVELEPMPFPQAEQPVTVVTPGPGPDPVTTLGDSGEAFASGHAAAPGPSWQEPVLELANERPELVVAAAFAGGVLAALILRRLGS